MKPLQIHIGHHFYGCGNIGDDLMLAGFLAALDRIGAAVTLTCAAIGDLASQRARFPGVHWTPHDIAAREASIAQCDLWLGVGGSPFQTETGTWFLDHLIADAALCGRYAKTMYFLGVGVNDLPAVRHPLTRVVLAQARHVWTRDERSAELLAGVCDAAKVTVGADLAHAYLAERPGVAIEPRTIGYVLNFEEPSQFAPRAIEHLVRSLPGWRHRWLVQEVRDLSGAERWTHAQLDTSTRQVVPLCLPDYASTSPQQLLAPWGAPQVIVSSRYHGAVVGAWLGSRLVLIQRNEKLRGLALQLGRTPLPDLRDAQVLTAAVDAAGPVPRGVIASLAARVDDSVRQLLAAAALPTRF